ncbi:hypothetical protein CDAR_291961 [Caerostris darwini]|uniref:Uncharacterized protein n=1 Tax=Caerostris darwini TaxID=1538125 RepID=A0AAV4PAD3_9ARAC|nr:hypothetical protein CDAR_291961 [Caerostris darwini]
MEVVKVEIRFWVRHNRQINADGRNRAPSEQQTCCGITSQGSRMSFSAEEPLSSSAGSRGMDWGANGGGRFSFTWNISFVKDVCLTINDDRQSRR